MTGLKTKYKLIGDQEKAWANSLARSMKEQRPLSVWEVLIPFLLIFNFARSRADREVFVQNMLFTKNHALKAALAITEKRRTRVEAMAPIEKQTSDLLESVQEGIYSETIRTNQLKEIDLLIEHYCKLLQAEGEDFAALVTNAYGEKDEYLGFLNRLKNVEKEVSASALDTVGPKGSPEFVETPFFSRGYPTNVR